MEILTIAAENIASCRVKHAGNVRAWCLPQSVDVCQGAAVVPGYERVAGARLSEVGLGRSDVRLACEYQASRSAHLSDQNVSKAFLIIRHTA